MASATTTKPDIVLFARGVIAILELWPALRVAVDESWGGPESREKRRWLAGEVVDTFEQSLPPPSPSKKANQETPDAVYVEEMLLQVMSDEYETVLEDGSAEVVAQRLVSLWELIVSGLGAKEEVEKFEAMVDKLKGKKVQVQVEQGGDEVDGDGDEGDWTDDDGDGDDDDNDAMDEDEAPQLLPPKEKDEPEVDEDGFTTVKRKGKSRR